MHPALKATLFKGGDPTLLWDEDYVNGVYRYNRVRYPAVTDLPGTTFTRATTKTALTSAGVLVSFGVGVPAITDAGLSIEGPATNLVVRSQELDLWTTLNASVVANATPAPDGTLTADKIVEDTTATAQHGVYRAFTTTSGQTYTTSFFVKAAERSWLYMTEANNVTAQASFNLATGALGTVSGNGSPVATITPLANGQLRSSLTFTPISTSSNIQARAQIANGGGSYTGDGISGIYAWGAQAELGPVATSYIPTTTVAVTRNADVLATADTAISPTIVAEFVCPTALASPTTYPTVLGFDDGTSGNIVLIWINRAAMTATLEIKTGGVAQAGISLGTVVPGQTYKIAARLVANDCAASINGATCVTDTSVTLPAVTTFRRGNSPAGTAPFGPGIRKIKRYSVAKTNAELQALAA